MLLFIVTIFLAKTKVNKRIGFLALESIKNSCTKGTSIILTFQFFLLNRSKTLILSVFIRSVKQQLGPNLLLFLQDTNQRKFL